MTDDVKITKDATVGKEIEATCGRCGEGKVHVVLGSIREDGSHSPNDEWSFEWIEKFEIIQCAGCKELSFRKTHSNSEDYGPDGHVETVEFFPGRVRGRLPVNDYELLPDTLEQIYFETLEALNSELPVLVGIGVRAVVETVCKDQRAAGRRLEDKIDDLVTKQVLTRAGARILHKLRVMGNKAAHEVEPHSLRQLGFAFDVIDNLVTAVYVLPHHAEEQFK